MSKSSVVIDFLKQTEGLAIAIFDYGDNGVSSLVELLRENQMFNRCEIIIGDKVEISKRLQHGCGATIFEMKGS